LPFKNKTNQFFLLYVANWEEVEYEKKKRRERKREKKGKNIKKMQGKKKRENNLVNLQSPTYKTLI
jgi:hypothetical protein